MPTKIIVIGGGPGGYVAALRAAALGGIVTLIEKENLVCQNMETFVVFRKVFLTLLPCFSLDDL